MNLKTKIIPFLSGLIIGVGGLYLAYHTNNSFKDHFDGFSSATPVALHQRVPKNCHLLVSGQIDKTWAMKASDFEELAQTRLRCIENEKSGTISGAYTYQGVPLLSILEGVRPSNRTDDPFDRPLDMVVIVKNQQGFSSWFSYGELTMCTDSDPVLLAFHREELRSSRDPEKYTLNNWHGPHDGLRLVASRDWDNSRHIDNASELQLLRPNWPSPEGTPTMKIPGKDAPIPTQVVMANGSEIIWQGRPDSLDLPLHEISDWRRFGHGRGLKSKSPEVAQGFRFSELSKKIYPDMNREDAILVVAIDGYRTLFSGREILEHPQGQGLLIQESTSEGQGWCLLSSGDFFVDRCVRSVSHIIRISSEEISKILTP